MGDLFLPLLNSHDLIGNLLWQMTLPQLRASSECYGTNFIAMHVRRGDLTRQGFSKQQLHKNVAQFTPNEWFISMARAVRREPSLRSVPVVVFTDGTSDELGSLLAIDGIKLHFRQPAIADLWTLTRARLFFASGFSTFSMWASFLGGMPTIYAPGKIQQRVQLGRPRPLEFELETGADLPAEVLEFRHV
jgi:hypothetical protein